MYATIIASVAAACSEAVGGAAGPAAGDPNAYDRYLEGLELLERWDQGDNLDRSVDLFRTAAELDPGFAEAARRLEALHAD